MPLRHRRCASAQSRHDRWQPGPRRSGRRPAGSCAGARGDDQTNRLERLALDRDRSIFSPACSRPRSPRARSSPRSICPRRPLAPAALRQVRQPSQRLRNGWCGGACDVEWWQCAERPRGPDWGGRPCRRGCSSVESALEGKPITAESIAAACEQAGAGMDLLGDIHASADYRAAMIKVYARRALSKALERAQG